MTYYAQDGVLDYDMRVSAGMIRGVTGIAKMGHAPAGVQTTATDIWGRADATPTQQIWLAPTAARIHAIVSSSTDDDGSPAGTGARTLRIWGLTSWTATDEVFEDVTLNGTTPVNTSNAYVMINHMRVMTSGTTSINVGTITATAATDSTVTAVIRPLDGNTEQAIYGIPSTKQMFIESFSAGMNDSGAQARVDMDLLIARDPANRPTIFHFEYSFHLQNSGASTFHRKFYVKPFIVGPAIIKLQGIASAADVDVSACIDMVVVGVPT